MLQCQIAVIDDVPLLFLVSNYSDDMTLVKQRSTSQKLLSLIIVLSVKEVLPHVIISERGKIDSDEDFYIFATHSE